MSFKTPRYRGKAEVDLQNQFIRPQRLFTVEHHIIVSLVGKVTAAKFDEVFKRVRKLFVD